MADTHILPNPVHIVGGGLAGSEAAWQIAEAGVPTILHEMRPLRRTDAHRGDALAELVCSNSLRFRRCRYQRGRCPAPRDAADGLADHARGRCQPGSGRRRAGGRPRGLCRRGHASDHDASTHRASPRRGRGPASGRLGQRRGRDGSPDGAGTRRGDRRPDRRSRSRVLRRDRAGRAPREHRPLEGVVPVALRQGRPRRHGRRLHQLPAVAPAIRSLRRRAACGRRGHLAARRHDALLSTAACRSRRWRAAAARRCATAR